MCTNMTTVILPSTLETITGRAFEGLTKLNNISFPNGNDNYQINDGCLLGNEGKDLIYVIPTKTEINIPDSVTTIKICAINSGDLEYLSIPDTVTTLENMIFRNTNNLKRIHIGSGVSSLSSQFKAWISTPNGLKIEIDGNNQNYKVEGNLILTKNETEVVTYVDGNVQSQTIPTNVVKIRNDAFLGIDATEIILQNTLKEIGAEAFRSCSNLISIEIPSSVETIGENAFFYCANLETIKINKAEGDLAGAPWGAPKGDRVLVWSE